MACDAVVSPSPIGRTSAVRHLSHLNILLLCVEKLVNTGSDVLNRLCDPVLVYQPAIPFGTRTPALGHATEEEIRKEAARSCGGERIDHTSEASCSQLAKQPLGRRVSRKELRKQQREQRRQRQHEWKKQWKLCRKLKSGISGGGLVKDIGERDAAARLRKEKSCVCTTPSSCSLTCNDGPQLEGAKTSFKDIPSRCELASSSDDVVPEEVCVDGGLLDTRGGLVLLASETGQDHLGAKPVANCYLEELRALEQKLGLEADLGDQVTQVTRRQRLRQELENDGFDSGLQDILDDILSSSYSVKGDGRQGADPDPKISEASVTTKDDGRKPHRFDDEIRLLECRLGVIDGDGEEACHSRKKLRRELEEDGFDADLQDFLDGILEGSSRVDTSSEQPKVRKRPAVAAEGELKGDCEVNGLSRTIEATSFPLPRRYVPPHKRERPPSSSLQLDTALQVVKSEVVRAFNRICEGNASPVFQMLLEVLQKTSLQLQEDLCHRQETPKHENLHKKFMSEVVVILCNQVEQSCITSAFTTTSLIATQIALCCALGKVWYLELCSSLVARIAVIFARSFEKAIATRQKMGEVQQGTQDELHDENCFNARHAVVAVCCLFDYGFLSSRLFVQVIRRVLGDASSQPMCEFRIGLLILLLRLGGSKLRQDSSSLFLLVWKEIHSFLKPQSEHSSQQKGYEPSSRTRALLLELEDIKAGKQKERQLLIKSSLTAMRQWLSSTAHFGPSLIASQYEIDGNWQELENGGLSSLSEAAAMAGRFQVESQKGDTDTAAPDAARICEAAKNLDHSASLLRFSTDLQRNIFSCLVKADGPDSALRLLQECGLLSTKQQMMLQVVGVALQCCLQEKGFNSYYGLVLARLCGLCCCQRSNVPSSDNSKANCGCFVLPEKPASRYRRVLQRGIGAQASAALGFSVRRLLNLAKLTAFLVRVNIVQLNVVRFLPFEENRVSSGPMGLSGKLGLFLKVVSEGILCEPSSCYVPLPEVGEWKKWSLKIFDSLKEMPDICEAFISLLKDVLLSGRSHGNANKANTGESKVDLELTRAAMQRLVESQEPAEA